MINQKLKLKNYPPLMEEIEKVLKTVSYGSVEIYVQNNKVTQMTVRKIVKTKYDINEEDNLTSQRKLNVKTSNVVKTIQISQNLAERGQNGVLTKDNR